MRSIKYFINLIHEQSREMNYDSKVLDESKHKIFFKNIFNKGELVVRNSKTHLLSLPTGTYSQTVTYISKGVHTCMGTNRPRHIHVYCEHVYLLTTRVHAEIHAMTHMHNPIYISHANKQK